MPEHGDGWNRPGSAKKPGQRQIQGHGGGDRFGWQVEKVETLVSQLARLGRVVDPMETVADITADPADNRVLEATVAGDAATIVSGDHHLLDLGTWRGIAILAPADFVRRASGGVRPGADPSGST